MRYHLAWLVAVYLAVLCPLILAGLFRKGSKDERSGNVELEAAEQNVVPYNEQYINYGEYEQSHQSHNKLARPRGRLPGSSLQTNRRPLAPWALADYLLVGTVDGSLHARDRKTGVELWSIPGDGPLVHVSSADAQKDDEGEITWIVEPTGDGALYYFTEDAGLRKMPVSIRQLVDESPFAINGDDKIYTGVRHTTLYSINATTGDILRVFGGDPDSLGKPQCRAFLDVDLEYDDFEDENNKDTDNGSFMIGKTDYHLAIHGKNESIWNVTFSTWGPNNMDADLAEQHIRSMDSLYITPEHSKSILAMTTDPRSIRPARWVNEVPSMVVEVFDLLKSPLRDSNDPLVLLPQPEYPFVERDIQQGEWHPDSAYVGRTKDDQWFALSGENFPSLVNTAPVAKWCRTPTKQKFATNHEFWNLLEGVHPLVADFSQSFSSVAPESAQTGYLGIGPGTPPLDIEPPPSSSYYQGLYDDSQGQHFAPGYPRQNRGNQVSQPAPRPATPPPPGRLGEPPASLWGSFVHLLIRVMENALTIGLLLFIAGMTVKYAGSSKFEDALSAFVAALKKDNVADTIANAVPEAAMFEAVETVESKDVREVVEQAVEAAAVDIEPKVVAENDIQVDSVESTKSDTESETEAVPLKIDENQDDQSSNLEENNDHRPEAKVSIIEPEKPVRLETADDKADKKKRKRGSRGGRRNNIAAKRERAEKEKQNNDEDGESDNIKNVALVRFKDTPEVGQENQGLDPRLQVYETDDNIIGRGSHGTVVYNGMFESRKVAVKRMILTSFDLASQEVKLLQESDDHPNVIRYHCKSQTDQFLYIALELCQGSVSDLIQDPGRFENVTQTMGQKDMLSQISEGLQYLHSLKIVHRDIKPQNILITLPKKMSKKVNHVRKDVYLARMVISDFGLCKKLEGEQSSFHATTAQVAGTVGWIAPEVERKGWSRPQYDEMSSSEGIMNGMDKNRRLTRAVDIFSLGCVFFFVLSNGEHPFGFPHERELNIAMNKYDLGPLGEDDFPDVVEARDLIEQMISHDPRKRPDAGQVLLHPYFWTYQERLHLLNSISDWADYEGKNDHPELLEEVESRCASLFPGEQGWQGPLDKSFLETLNAYRKYQPDQVLHLLRAIRNKSNHYDELPESLQRKMPLPDGFLLYFTSKFPGLFITIYYFAKDYLSDHKKIGPLLEREG